MKKGLIYMLVGVPFIALGLDIIFGEKLQILADDFVINLDLFGEFQITYVFPLIQLLIFVCLYIYNRSLKIVRRKEFAASFISLIYLTVMMFLVDNYVMVEPVSSKMLGMMYGGTSLLVGFGFVYYSHYFLLPHDLFVAIYSVHTKKKYIGVKIVSEFIVTFIVFFFVKHSVIDLAFLIYLLIVYSLNAIIADFAIDLDPIERREKKRILEKLQEVRNRG